ncbi:P-loop NTPase fold protein [Thermotoga sp. SG1]|uniref:P-loop NTPase fold protein n=1 Tax=Thermotoga sp. SG1 TaxID=126739 RepID=UPI000CB049E0|nr:P-loop NTPase fold protein [Thermotoga sp. SG1]PLV56746.1 ATPase [Thermotoga sp. SG1]
MKQAVADLLSVLVDRPLREGESEYLVNRSREINYLNSIALHQPFGIVGVSGETGIGKTTVLNFVNPEGVFTIRVNISLRDSMESVLYDLLHSLAFVLEKIEGVSDLAKKVRRWITDEVSTIKGFSLGVSFGMSASLTHEKSIRPRFNFFEAREKLGELIKHTVQKKGKFLLIIDELDKEKKEDVLRVIDSIKNFIIMEDFVVILSLPFSIYREYAADRLRWNEAGNLENIFKDIVFVEPLKKLEIKELIIKRLGSYIELLEDGVLDIVAEFSDGNPRDGLWILTKAIYDNIHKERLSKEDLINTINRTIAEYTGLTLNLTENQKKAIRILRGSVYTREKIIETLQKEGIKRTTAYSVMDQLLQKRILLVEKEGYRISGKFRYIEI